MRPYSRPPRPSRPARDRRAISSSAALADLETWEPKIGAFVALNLCRRPRRAAGAATKRWRDGTPRSPIDGMPVGIKDIIENHRHGRPRQGSPLFVGYQKPSAMRVGRGAARGGRRVVVGKTVTTEFAFFDHAARHAQPLGHDPHARRLVGAARPPRSRSAP